MTTFAALLLAQLSVAAPLPNFDFSYQPAEGEAASPCVKKQVQDLPDWDVACPTPYGLKNFGAHVIVREYPRADNSGVEVLYWVTERNGKPADPRQFHSTTAFFHLKGATSLSDFSLSQGIENDQASLVLGWAAAGARR